jgi:hypothetical protein
LIGIKFGDIILHTTNQSSVFLFAVIKQVYA